MTVRNLEALFHPKSVAVIGGSDRTGSLGTHVLDNIVTGGFQGQIAAVNPRKVGREGVEWVTSIEALKFVPDLAVIVTPASTVPELIARLGAKGVRDAVVISAGLHDAALRRKMLEAAKPHLLRIIGPNCLGVQLPHARLNASFAPRSAAPGRLAFVSQSGALVTAMLDWASRRDLGFSAVLSVGDMADVDLGDLLDMLAADNATDAILLYVEGVTDAPKFLSAARAAARVKPVVAVKAGRSAAAGQAALSHTRALVGDWDVYAAAFHRAGIVLVDSLTELFDAAQLLSQIRPSANCRRLGIITNGGGAGVLAADALAETHGALAELSPASVAALDPHLPPGWSRANPLDLVGDARADRFTAAVQTLRDDDGVDALLVIHCPTAVATGTEIAISVAEATANAGGRAKPVIACWMGSANAAAARPIFERAKIPLFDNLDDAVRGFGRLVQANEGRAALLRAPARVTRSEADRAVAGQIIAAARAAGRTTLSAPETRALIAAYGIPTVRSVTAASVDDVAAACAGLSAPYAVKLVSPAFPHKSDVGGVRLGLASPEAAATAAAEIAEHIAREHPDAPIDGFEIEPMVAPADGIELLLGIADNATFGPILAFGAGGEAVEVLRDRALGLPPLDDALAGAMIDGTRVSRLLAGYRNVAPADRGAIIRALNGVSAIAVDWPDILELDINPLLATSDGVIALDARARISEQPRAARLAIRPVPVEWTAELVTRSGLKLHVRPVVPSDEATLADLFAHMSPEDLRFRFLTGLPKVDRERLVALTQVDYRRTINFLAFAGDILVASAMLVADPDHVRAELAVATRADFKARGVSWALVEHVMRYARAEGISVVESIESSENHAALALEREAGFAVVPREGAPGEILVRRNVR
ncbi:MAG: GNAT family N-acetyltransferase [Sphingomonas sp.]|nr:GNAT family N-acetyltransferase [Sphingomonas sp.]